MGGPPSLSIGHWQHWALATLGIGNIFTLATFYPARRDASPHPAVATGRDPPARLGRARECPCKIHKITKDFLLGRKKIFGKSIVNIIIAWNVTNAIRLKKDSSTFII